MHSTRYLFGVLILALTILGGAVLLRLVRQEEPRTGLALSVEFRDARGLRAGADVRYRGVRTGAVRAVRIAEDGSSAVADLLLDPVAAPLACVHSSFWIVTPRFAGLAGGASGLDTLVRDAYIAFVTPTERGSPLRSGTTLAGSEVPAETETPEGLGDVQHGDLRMSLLVPENHGLAPGSPVVFRGVTTGEVRSVMLAADGTHVELQLRIRREYRRTVTDKAEFWIARPSLSGALWTGYALQDAKALLQPFVGYYVRPGAGTPAEDGYCTIATATRPDAAADDVPKEALHRHAEAATAPPDGVVLARVVYTAVERDTFSPSDPVHREGTGVLWLDATRRVCVLTARSACDGNYTESDPFGALPDIAEEQCKVLLAGGGVLRAHRVWVDPDGLDLALLVLDNAPPDLPTTPVAHLRFAPLPPTVVGEVQAVRPDAAALPAVELKLPTSQPALETHRGGAILVDRCLIALWGQRAARKEEPAVVPIDRVPADLRPAR